MLKSKTDKQRKKVAELIRLNMNTHFIADNEEGCVIDGYVSYDTMEAIVKLLSSEPNDELFEQCWVAYRRKGNKKKSKEYWRKLTDAEKNMVMPHAKAYVSSRDVNYQKDFERYLRDKVFCTVVFSNNNVIYDPTKAAANADSNEVYMPTCGGALSWNDYYSSFIFVGFWDGRHISDGYTDETRPNGATIMLNNGRGRIQWSSESKQWNRIEKLDF